MEAIEQILRSDSIMQLRNTNGSRNGKRMLYEGGSNSHDTLKRGSATLAAIVLLGIASSCGEIRIEVGIAQVPTPGRKSKPPVCRGIRESLTSSTKVGIEQIRICDMRRAQPSSYECGKTVVLNEPTSRPQFR